MTEKQIRGIVLEKMAHRPKIIKMFENCYKDTLENTVRLHEDGTAFMLTGDIPAMWLRDSTNQLRPYLLTAKDDKKVTAIIEGVIKKQLLCILRDPYANAFNEYENGHGHQLFLKAAATVVDLWILEQNHEENSDYTFDRLNTKPHDTLSHGGKGAPVGYTGMTWSGFRPSDDSCVYGYLIPSNMFAVVVLGYLREIISTFYKNETELLEKASRLQKEIRNGIEKFGMIESEKYGKVYAFETDGLGNYNIMDDANVPSLMAMPYFWYCDCDDEIYLNTRRMMLSEENPYYYEGKFAKGIGSPHTPEGYIWHIALSIQGMTSAVDSEKEQILDWFETTDAGTNLVHEGFHKDDPAIFTREWFSWSNAMFVEFVLSVCGLTIKNK